ncbi:uncharacterized protein LOC126808478 isoform X2 [Patella vulgata]|nr:uncharacterized protein LOC126808478 isoform X2 [Patella vulgata]XP_050389169.1 uncharacterized protein LOC126808478 isoform X2 [Patella vulgata]XP_050389170.1 uncharacterized protein LOC126808478 isoform X2 [Patella vulgata]
MCEVFSFPSSSKTRLSVTEVIQLSNMASYGLPINLLFCKLCQKVFTDPKLLPCLHTYCHTCLQTQLNETDKITCTLCGYFMNSPTGGISVLTTNIFAERVVKQYINKIQEFASNENTGDPNTDQETVSTLMEKAKYSPSSLSLFSLQRRDTFSSPGNRDIKMSSATTDKNGNPSSIISAQPDLVQSHASAEDTLHIMVDKLSSHMDHKLMALQGEALRVTYAIDSINQSVNNWREKRYRLKRKVEERSNILQHQIRRHEKRLLAEVDSRYHEEKMMKDAERSKQTLRQNLKGILQTVEFLKQVQEYATDEEMVALKDRLMFCSVNISEVQMKWQELQLETPTESPDVLMSANFGQLNNLEQSSVVFIPGSLEMERDLSAENTSFNQSIFNERLLTYSTSPPISRRVKRQSTRVSESENEADVSFSDASVTVDQFRTMRESFKQRRRQLLEGNSNTMDTHPFTDKPFQTEVPIASLSNRKRVVSLGGNATNYYLDNPEFEHQAQIPSFTQALPPNATSRDIMERNEISRQMAHLSHEDREDKIKRMQNLRESWKRRKEVLMQNDGYISPKSNDTITFEYEAAVEEIVEQPTAINKQSRMKQLKNRFSQIRQHFKPDQNLDASKADQASPPDGVILRNKPKEKKEKRWSGIFRTKDSKRRSLSSRSSTEFVIEDDNNEDSQENEKAETENLTTEKTQSNSRSSGLTRTKLQLMRASVRKKTQRWRSFSSNNNYKKEMNSDDKVTEL